MRILLKALFLMMSAGVYANTYVFVSFSMPHQLLLETLKESTALQIPAVLNGLHQNKMPETVDKIMQLSQDIPNLELQIDPTLFERFSIHQVPALVVEKNTCFDVMYGNLRLSDGLKRIEEQGECR